MPRIFRLVCIAVVAAIAVTAPLSATRDESVSYSGRVVNFDEPMGRAPGLVQVRVSRWSTDAERDLLTDALMRRGQSGLLDELSTMPAAGVIRTPGTAGYTFRYARRMPGTNGEEQILVVIDRPIGFAEFRQGWQTRDYPFTVVRMQINVQGEGDGQILGATKLAASSATGDIAFEQYHVSPLLLQNVRRE
jgi:hypothetical protein